MSKYTTNLTQKNDDKDEVTYTETEMENTTSLTVTTIKQSPPEGYTIFVSEGRVTEIQKKTRNKMKQEWITDGPTSPLNLPEEVKRVLEDRFNVYSWAEIVDVELCERKV
jgi:hypothetical protein